MAPTGLYGFFILAAFVAANIPWVSDRFLMVFKRDKNAWLRWLEWLAMYVLAGALSVALEYKLTGTRHVQGWEFYVATLCLFLVFALPGFIYHYDLKRLLSKKTPD
jgi:hypothetical protein